MRSRMQSWIDVPLWRCIWTQGRVDFRWVHREALAVNALSSKPYKMGGGCEEHLSNPGWWCRWGGHTVWPRWTARASELWWNSALRPVEGSVSLHRPEAPRREATITEELLRGLYQQRLSQAVLEGRLSSATMGKSSSWEENGQVELSDPITGWLTGPQEKEEVLKG